MFVYSRSRNRASGYPGVSGRIYVRRPVGLKRFASLTILTTLNSVSGWDTAACEGSLAVVVQVLDLMSEMLQAGCDEFL